MSYPCLGVLSLAGWSGTPLLTFLPTQANLAQSGSGDGLGLGPSQVGSLEIGWDCGERASLAWPSGMGKEVGAAR